MTFRIHVHLSLESAHYFGPLKVELFARSRYLGILFFDAYTLNIAGIGFAAKGNDMSCFWFFRETLEHEGGK